ncbi:hypothetical protein MAR_001582 [Mya arenaria]|uniref:Uncharacterized protein n=1 Tax=Mya arenaria TaxID=6604 RepID=A0ABY7FFV6_MYAAR|nr:hypothetical protein MAR_001582 [Mya arenaria]
MLFDLLHALKRTNRCSPYNRFDRRTGSPGHSCRKPPGYVKRDRCPMAQEALGHGASTNSPTYLQDKVFVDFMLFFCNRGRYLNVRNKNEQYIELNDMQTKNHSGKGKLYYDRGEQGGRIYRYWRESCPYASFMRYMTVLNYHCESFFQRPKTKPTAEIWFDAKCLGKNTCTIGNQIKSLFLSLKVKLSRTYTNHLSESNLDNSP